MAKTSEEKHISQTPFAELLSQFVGDSGGGGMSPYTGGGLSISPATMETIKPKKEKERPKASDDGFDIEYLDEDDDLSSLGSLDELEEAVVSEDDFDAWIEEAFIEDEDVTFRNSLIAMGRKYAIKSMEEDGEISEVNKSFIHHEQAIHSIIEEIGADERALGRDLEVLRASRTKSYKALSDLASVKSSLHSTKLSAIKALTDIEKSKYEIKMKLDKSKNEGATDSGMAATQAVQRLLSVGRKNLIGSDDDYDDEPIMAHLEGEAAYSDGRAESLIHLAADIPPASSDGDIFIDHEDDGVEWVLDLQSDGSGQKIYAINKHGDLVPDFPLPSKPEELQFQINEMAGQATDQLQRTYRLRRDGVDTTFEASYADD